VRSSPLDGLEALRETGYQTSMPLSREELYQRLDHRLADPSLAAEQDDELWQELGQTRAIFVMDLSGFTRLTRTRGILHFLSLYRRAIRFTVPILEQARGRLVKREADNLIAVFESPIDALASARSIVAASAALDSSLDEDSRVYPCIGLGYGRILELLDDVFGDEVNLAFKLAEDIAKKREILLTSAAKEALSRESEPLSVEPLDVTLGGVSVPYFRWTADTGLTAR
jgi:class 3 adenylate cyclase